jgi:hypothetical protein
MRCPRPDLSPRKFQDLGANDVNWVLQLESAIVSKKRRSHAIVIGAGLQAHLRRTPRRSWLDNRSGRAASASRKKRQAILAVFCSPFFI